MECHGWSKSKPSREKVVWLGSLAILPKTSSWERRSGRSRLGINAMCILILYSGYFF